MNNNDLEELKNKIKELEEENKRLKKRKKYGLVWEDHPENLDINAFPMLTNEKDFDILSDNINPTNILIEGDNFHSLKSLLYTHKNLIDVIYIDPPYNTGNEFIYNDKIVDNEDSYKHSKWLSFISKRLDLSRQLLSEKGIIFISIDDNEFSQLKLLCDAIFDEKNFVANFIRKTSNSVKTSKTNVDRRHEYLLCYCKNINSVELRGNLKEYKSYSNPDNDPNGDWTKDVLVLKIDNGRTGKNAKYPIHNEYLNITHYPPANERKQWHYTKDKFEELKKNGQVVFYKTPDEFKGEYSFFIKKYKKDLKSDRDNIDTLFSTTNDFINSVGTKDLKELMGDKIFDAPKPVSLIKKILEYSTTKDSIILDFFAGSGTTGHAVLELNKEDGGNRKFILCTNNENKICEEVTYPRVKKVMDIGLISNLKYYKTKEIGDINKPKIKDIDEVVKHSIELLKIKHGTFVDKRDDKTIHISQFNEEYLCVLKTVFEAEAFIDNLKHNKYKKNIYIFSHDEDSFNSIKEEISNTVHNFEIHHLPEEIIRYYRRLQRKGGVRND